MHKHILIPTDGPELSNKAIQYGTALSNSVNAKVTGVTVSIPLHTFAVDADMVTDAHLPTPASQRPGADRGGPSSTTVRNTIDKVGSRSTRRLITADSFRAVGRQDASRGPLSRCD